MGNSVLGHPPASMMMLCFFAACKAEEVPTSAYLLIHEWYWHVEFIALLSLALVSINFPLIVVCDVWLLQVNLSLSVLVRYRNGIHAFAPQILCCLVMLSKLVHYAVSDVCCICRQTSKDPQLEKFIKDNELVQAL